MQTFQKTLVHNTFPLSTNSGRGYETLTRLVWLVGWYCPALLYRFRYSFICQGTSTRRQRSDLFGLRVELPPVTTSL